MNRQDQIQYCALCKHKDFSKNFGQVCGLSGVIPMIDERCNDFDSDPVEQDKRIEQEYRSRNRNKSQVSVFTIIVFILILIRLIMRLSK